MQQVRAHIGGVRDLIDTVAGSTGESGIGGTRPAEARERAPSGWMNENNPRPGRAVAPGQQPSSSSNSSSVMPGSMLAKAAAVAAQQQQQHQQLAAHNSHASRSKGGAVGQKEAQPDAFSLRVKGISDRIIAALVQGAPKSYSEVANDLRELEAVKGRIGKDVLRESGVGKALSELAKAGTNMPQRVKTQAQELVTHLKKSVRAEGSASSISDAQQLALVASNVSRNKIVDTARVPKPNQRQEQTQNYSNGMASASASISTTSTQQIAVISGAGSSANTSNPR
ncbi:unnamed protein product, partial [Amoebophrya sp. A25]|eukprot:GSA25T00004519001.1